SGAQMVWKANSGAGIFYNPTTSGSASVFNWIGDASGAGNGRIRFSFGLLRGFQSTNLEVGDQAAFSNLSLRAIPGVIAAQGTAASRPLLTQLPSGAFVLDRGLDDSLPVDLPTG